MIAFALPLLFTLTFIIAVAVIADSLVAARAAWTRLMREGEVMRAGIALQAAATEMRLRPAAPRAIAVRRQGMLRPQGLPACAAA